MKKVCARYAHCVFAERVAVKGAPGVFIGNVKTAGGSVIIVRTRSDRADKGFYKFLKKVVFVTLIYVNAVGFKVDFYYVSARVI